MARMDKAQAAEVVQYLGRLFPRWVVTKELAVLWADSLTSHDQATALRICREHRTARNAEDPHLGTFMELLIESEPKPKALPMAATETSGRTTPHSLATWMRIARESPEQFRREGAEFFDQDTIERTLRSAQARTARFPRDGKPAKSKPRSLDQVAEALGVQR